MSRVSKACQIQKRHKFSIVGVETLPNKHAKLKKNSVSPLSEGLLTSRTEEMHQDTSR